MVARALSAAPQSIAVDGRHLDSAGFRERGSDSLYRARPARAERRRRSLNRLVRRYYDRVRRIVRVRLGRR
jgi:hypothetical protein